MRLLKWPQSLVALVSLTAWPQLAIAAETTELATRIGELETRLAATEANSNLVWIMVASALVLSMQIGFLFLEAGLARSKHSINVALKNATDFMIAAVVFWIVGFSLMFGQSIGGWIGSPSQFAMPSEMDANTMAFMVFQTMFVGTAATIVSGAVAERMTFAGYLVVSAVISLVVYPLFGHWAWGTGLIKDNASWLAGMGFIDFAGSTVVHSIGGWMSLAGVIVLGARIGRFGKNGEVLPMHGHSTVLTAAGALILFVGWIGFNAGSTLAATPAIAKIALNTILAGAFGAAAAMVCGRLRDGHWLATRPLNGLLAGLVGITAGCDAVLPGGAVMIGLICGIAVLFVEDAILHIFKLDDVVGAVAVHGAGGALGTLLVAFFATPDKLVAGSVWQQFLVQALGVGTGMAWALATGFLMFGVLSLFGWARVSEEAERVGLNVAEHGASLGTGILQGALNSIVRVERDLTMRLDESSGDETAEIAAILNPFIADMQKVLSDIGQHARQVETTSARLAGVSADSVARAERVSQGTLTMSDAADHLNDRLGDFAMISTNMGGTSLEVAQATRDMSNAIDSVTKLVETLANSVREVTNSATDATEIASSATSLVQSAQGAMGSLSAATREIEDIVGLIEAFAGKTNLLALNATIEAARAGEAGRGFAVVAHEIKQLAHDTTRATDEIRRKVETVRATGAVTGKGIDEVRIIVETMDATMADIAASARRQSEIAAHVFAEAQSTFTGAKRVAQSTSWIHETVQDLGRATEEMTRDASRVDVESEQAHANALAGVEHAREVATAANSLGTVSQRMARAVDRYRT